LITVDGFDRLICRTASDRPFAFEQLYTIPIWCVISNPLPFVDPELRRQSKFEENGMVTTLIVHEVDTSLTRKNDPDLYLESHFPM
jgi:hypothetical protein